MIVIRSRTHDGPWLAFSESPEKSWEVHLSDLCVLHVQNEKIESAQGHEFDA
jgi:hypothetical protein